MRMSPQDLQSDWERLPNGAYKRRNRPQTHQNESGAVQTPSRPQKRLKQGIVKLNALEQRFFDDIKGAYPNYPPIRAQAVTFILSPGNRYTPDFYCARWPDLARDSDWETVGPAKTTCIEVKGRKSWDDAIVKIKTAKTIFPEINWWFVDDHNGQWRWQRML